MAALAGSYGSLIHFIRHQATLALLGKYIPISNTPNPELYKYEVGNALLVVTLKNPQHGQELSAITENDVELFLVSVV